MSLIICGVDEAGRGPLAGPVVAAAVILNPEHPIHGLADSKKLSAAKRERLDAQIREHALAWCIAQASVDEIDTLNILRASLLAMKRAVEGLGLTPQEVRVDGNFTPDLAIPARAIIGGDATEPAISAASILAKTERDAIMAELHEAYPHYGLAQHKGYPTAAHLAALKAFGVSPIYRKSFGPVKALLAQRPEPEKVQGTLGLF